MKVKMPTILALGIGKVKTARTAWQDRLSSVSWLLHLPSTCFRIGSKLGCILPSQMSMASARTKCFECLASTGAYTPGTQRIIGLSGGATGTRNVGWMSVAGRNRNRMADGKSAKANKDFFYEQAQDLLALLHIQRLRTCTQFFAKSTQALS